MARPAGHPINPKAWDDVLRLSGMSLTKVAERADLKRPTLSSLVSNHHWASVPMAHAIADAVGCHPETLFPTLRPITERKSKRVAA